MSVGVILGKMPEDCNDCKIVIHNEEEFRCPLCPYYNFTGFDSMVPPDECPLQEVEPARYGEWLYADDYDDLRRCSECDFVVKAENISQYCPHCGARMDGDSE